MTRWTIEAVPLYSFAAPGPEVFYQRDFFEIIDMVIYSYVLRSDAGTILIDTGLPSDLVSINESRTRKGSRAQFKLLGEGLADRLCTAGIKSDAIVLTSFGRYAASGTVEFPSIDLHVSARGLAHMNDPEEPALVHPLAEQVMSRINEAVPVSHEEEIQPGLVLIETGVHHPGSLSVVVSTEEGRIAVSDFVFVARNLTEGLTLGCAENVAGWHGMVRRIGAMAEAIMPIHDPSPEPIRRDRWHPNLQTGPLRGAA